MGVPSVSSSDTSGVLAAAKLASEADAVVLALGTDLSLAAEGRDAVEITLPPGQKKLLEVVAFAAKRPVVVVMLTAVPLDLSELLASSEVGAILHVGQPAVQTHGVADVLFGRKPPAGRLVQTIYPASYAPQISIFDFNMRPGPSVWPRPDCQKSAYGHCPLGTNPGRTHRFYTGVPVLPFGFGLSYTSFEYEIIVAPMNLSLAPLEPLLKDARYGFVKSGKSRGGWSPSPRYTVLVRNTGEVDADEVVLGFLVPPGAGKDGVPLQTLFGFQRVHVPAGDYRLVDLEVAFADFSQVDKNGSRRALPGRYQVHFGPKWAGMAFAQVDLDTHMWSQEPRAFEEQLHI